MSTPLTALVMAVGNEAQAHHGRYLELARRAGKLGYPQVAKLLRAIVAAETARVGLYRECLAHSDSPEETDAYYICPTCGLAITVAPPDHCPLCQTPGARFERIV